MPNDELSKLNRESGADEESDRGRDAPGDHAPIRGKAAPRALTQKNDDPLTVVEPFFVP